MYSFMKFFITVLVSSSLSLLNLTAYAGPGNSGHGGGGQGMGHGGGQGMGHGNGQGIGHGNGQGIGHSNGHGVGLGHGKSMKGANPVANQAHNQKVNFSKTDRATITDYVNKNPLSANALPPGIRMNLARGKPLPPGIEKRFLPSNLVSTLPVYPGYEYLAAGNDVVLVNSTTGIVADILSGVLK